MSLSYEGRGLAWSLRIRRCRRRTASIGEVFAQKSPGRFIDESTLAPYWVCWASGLGRRSYGWRTAGFRLAGAGALG